MDQRSLLAERLRACAAEIQEAILDRLRALDGDDPVRDLDYLRGLNEAVRQGVEYGIEVVAIGAERAEPAPLALITQARLAARHQIPLELVIRHYAAAKSTFQRFVMHEVAAMPELAPVSLASVLAAQDSVLDRLIEDASEEYRRETSAPCLSPEARLVQRIRRLLSGESVDPSLLEYNLSGPHLALVARSSAVRPQLRKLSAECDGRLLLVAPEDETWAWIGTRQPLDVDRVLKLVARTWPDSISLGIGEVGEDLSGWRQSHEQARAAAGIARPRRERSRQVPGRGHDRRRRQRPAAGHLLAGDIPGAAEGGGRPGAAPGDPSGLLRR